MQVVNYNKPVMSSREIAVQVEKMHKDVMKSIRNMEPAWEKTCGRKFALTYRDVPQPNGGFRKEPEYLLTKTETLYIATKFNDEARARLILRWEELETQQQPANTLDQLLQQASLELQLKIEERDRLNEEIDKYRKVIGSHSPELLISKHHKPSTIEFLNKYIPLWKIKGYIPVNDFRTAYNNTVPFEDRIGLKVLFKAVEDYCAAHQLVFKKSVQKRILGIVQRVHIFQDKD